MIISGEFDLAAGAVFVLTGIVATRLHAEFGTYPALLIGIAVATACGAVNGLLVAYVKVNSFVCTLATSIIVFGVTLAVTKGKLITITESSYGTLGGAKLLGVKYSIWIMLIVGLLCGFVLSRTKFGRRLFAVGGNPEAARLSGINVRGIKLAAFVISGFAAGSVARSCRRVPRSASRTTASGSCSARSPRSWSVARVRPADVVRSGGPPSACCSWR